jgi:hypothetical protein
MKQTVKAECNSCDGTGIYCGFAEPKGVGVICLTCDGTGCQTITYKPFEKLKKRRDIQKVARSRGSFIATGVGPTRELITYDEFLAGKR